MPPPPEAIEMMWRRTRHAKHWQLPGGDRIAEVSKHRHWLKNGLWRPVDLGLYAQGGGRWKTDGHDVVIDADGTGLSVYDEPTGKGIRFLFPVPPDRVDGRSAYWTRQGIEWRFTLGRLGLKTEGTVPAKRGPRTYSFDGQMLGGLNPPNPNANGDLVQPGGHFVIPRSVVIGANNVRYPCSAWRRSGGTIEFDFDDTSLPVEALPYVIDPTTTFDVAASADDGASFGSNAVYASIPDSGGGGIDTSGTGHPLAEKKLDAGTFWLTTGIITWDTSTLPDDAIIDSVDLEVWITSKGDNDGRSLLLDWYAGRPLDGADFLKTGTGTAASLDLSLITAGALNVIALTGFAANINKTGYSGVQGTISGGQPTADNSVWYSTFDHATDPAPQLVVTYHEPSSDSVAFGEATSIRHAWF